MLNEKETVEMIKTINSEYQIVVDPHTAVAVKVANDFIKNLELKANIFILNI